MKKRKIVLTAAALMLAVVFLLPRFWIRHHAREYLEEKYNKYSEVIRLEDVTVDKIQIDIFTGQYSVLMAYDNVAFEVYNGNDTYTERYLGKRYVEAMRSGDMAGLVSGAWIILLDTPTGTAALDRTDVKFQLTLNFEKTFTSKEEYAAAVRQALDRLGETKLTACDLLMTYGYVNDRLMECSVSPMWDEPTDTEILTAVTVSLLGT